MERYFPTDVLVNILQRLPPSSLRRARLVCRLWRDVVNERTTEMQSRAKPLLWDTHSSIAYVIDDLSSSGSCRELWKSAATEHHYHWMDRRGVQLIGTCNGLLCICDNDKQASGAIMVVNPVTGEMLPVPPLPCPDLLVRYRGHRKLHEEYNFTYHPSSGRYKLVHVPCSYAGSMYSPVCKFNVIHVLTLGETTWREVQPCPGAVPRCNLAAGIVSVDGKTYWVTVSSGGAPKVVSFDLDNECITSKIALPVVMNNRDRYHLTEVNWRLGFVRGDRRVDVWVLEKGQRWSRRYNLGQRIPRPHFTFVGECVLTVGDRWSFHAHRWKGAPSSSGWRLRGDKVVRIGYQDKGTLVANMMGCVGLDNCRSFAYVETKEPLSVHVAD